jgi:AcrR family transcriptional regulator
MTAPARRGQLLDVTNQLVAERGFAAVSIQAVARRAGISRPIVYEHFGDLSGLLEALVEREMGRALAQISETELGAARDPPPAACGERLLTHARWYLDNFAPAPRAARSEQLEPSR